MVRGLRHPFALVPARQTGDALWQMFTPAFPATWHWGYDDSSLVGWTVTAAYLFAAGLCAQAGLRMRRASGNSAGQYQPWWFLAAVLLFLGLNKQLDLQTLLINAGRGMARAEGWFGYRRIVQAAFVVLFTLALVAGLVACVTKWRPFFRERPLVLAGLLSLLLLVVIRASGFNHVEELLHLDLHDDSWGWALELGGTVCVAWPATKVP